MPPSTKPRLPATSGTGTALGLLFTWMCNFGEVFGGGATLNDILGLSGDEQYMMEFFCGSNVATDNQISDCNLPYGGARSSPVSGVYGATRVQISAPGTGDEDHNPPRVATRNVFDLAVGTDNLLRSSDSNLRSLISVRRGHV